MKRLDFGLQAAFSDLNQRVHDADFLRDFPETGGNFVKHPRRGADYWYFRSTNLQTGKRQERYVGPDSNPEIRERVERFHQIRTSALERSELIGALVSVGIPEPDFLTASVVNALAREGFFRLRGVMVGTVAFNTYPGLVGFIPDKSFQTGDVDFAQDHGISFYIDDKVGSVLEALQAIDSSFRPVPSLKDLFRSSQFVNKNEYKVEFLVPNRGSDEHTGRLTTMPALSDAKAQPLRYLDYLIQNPVRSTMMFAGGIGVLVPQPARYAVHKMLVSVQRQDIDKAKKDLAQAAFLIEAMSQSAPQKLAEAWLNAWDRGPRWRENMSAGLRRLETTDPGIAQMLRGNTEKFGSLLLGRKITEADFSADVSVSSSHRSEPAEPADPAPVLESGPMP